MEHLRQLDSRGDHGGIILSHGLGGIHKNREICDLCCVMDQAIEDYRQAGLRPLMDFPPESVMEFYSNLPDDTRVLLRLRGVDGDGFAWFGDESWRRNSTCDAKNPGFAVEILAELTFDSSKPEYLLVGILSLYLRDAKPGLKYLWVDAICIVQDDKADWKRHTLIMGSIYANATLTIAAASASSGEEGCYLQDPDVDEGETPPHPYEARTPCIYSGRYLGDVLVVPFHKRHRGLPVGLGTGHSNLYTDLRTSRWDTRAWVFQERFFSRRIVYFAKSQVYWQCQTFMAGQNFPWLESMAGRGVRERDGRWKGLKHLKHTWRVFLASYTRAGISYPSDRLPALASIAREAEQIYRRSYVAGLFVDTFPQSLLWIANNLEGKLRVPAGVSPLERASSWSWAHWEGPINPDPISNHTTSSHLGAKDIRILKFGHDDSHHRSALIFSSSMGRAARSPLVLTPNELQMFDHKGGYRYGFSVEKAECHAMASSRGFLVFDDPDSAPIDCELIHIGRVQLNSHSTLRGRTKGEIDISLAVEVVARPPELEGQIPELPCYKRLGVAYQIRGHAQSAAAAVPTPTRKIILL
ncbi:hypothetical protein MAPG_01868 [Magnaporthiopsis poae ATCC 64411]|uniref:Heterokaryon incompatibility domain-containing protein n=1 Tax=Magnaporthiopsis poae (strain ATCC 64411 / 73-15) TaxID=644358 RepID=A0A0C4DPU2_MAGP6|nr:hypothetical protein MAPG_01868 [Magnaporthiopsis poae ATCC 64411]